MNDPATALPREIEILWSEDGMLVANKPAGMLTHNAAFSGPRERSLRQALGEQLGEPVYPVHRLDRGTSGAILFARAREDIAPWQEALAQPESLKVYAVLCRGILEGVRESTRPVKDSEGTPRPARTVFASVATSKEQHVSLVLARVDTGRHHQIRRHLAGMSHPVVGDATHGNSRFNREFRERIPLATIGLHALVLEVAIDGAALAVQAPFSPAFGGAVEACFCDEINITMRQAIDLLRSAF